MCTLPNSIDSGTCSSTLYSEKLGVQRLLNPGENEIDFTAKDIVQIQFSCGMGMYRGYFNVAN